ncbi:MAG: endonuclease/exonuclease/phosphatase family protein [Synechococcales bacterium]|nr:endonuclease/exonuclease/phosphatase family protein [Synechococcales bacterium]
MPSFSVMTFNVRGTPAYDDVNHWQHRGPLNLRTIQTYAPDLIGFQELQVGNAATYEQAFPYYQWTLGAEYNRPGRLLYCGIYWNTARWRPLQQGSFYLSETCDRWSSSWGSARIKVATWVVLEWVAGAGDPLRLVHLNTHLDHGSAIARQRGAKLILEKLNDLNPAGLPVVLTGDFNTPLPLVNGGTRSAFREPNAHDLFCGQGFCDTFLACGHRDAPGVHTVHNFQGEGFTADEAMAQQETDQPINWRLDWVLTRNGTHHAFSTQSCQIIKDAEPPVYPSDHYPVIAHLELA